MILVALTLIVLAFIFGGAVLGIAAIVIAISLFFWGLDAQSKRSDAIYHLNHPDDYVDEDSWRP
jgi:hypothetical protein